MPRSIRTAALLAAALAMSQGASVEARAQAAPGGFTAAQRAEIVAIVRDALKTDPSILRDAVNTLRAADEQSQDADRTSAAARHRAELLVGDAVAGNASGDVTLTEFYDPRCPYCKRMVPTIDRAIAEDPKLRVVFKVIPILGAPSVIEARAILAAGKQGRYVAMQEALMRDQAPPTDAEVTRIARSVGVDPVRLARDADAPDVTKQIADNIALARALHADGTPTLVIGSQVIPGALDPDDLKRAIAAARA